MKILVVDDELVSREKMLKILSSFGSCQEAQTGRGAISMCEVELNKGRPFDLIALDIGLPDLQGIDALVEIRELEKLYKIGQSKVLMVTGVSDRDSVITSIQAGCDSYIVKHFNMDMVVLKLHDIGIDL